METSADQNSAGILSVFHCILTWSFAVSANKHADPEGRLKGEKIQAMVDIYRHMRTLRLTIHKIKNPDFITISEVAKPFYVFCEMSKENWNEELRSLMGEIVNMRDVLQTTDIIKCTTLFGVENGSQPKNIISLLTLWYWLAAWSSSPDQPENGGAKYEFMEAIEANDKMLGFLLVNTSPIHPVEQQELQVLFAKLLQMLKSDHLFWSDILNQFTDKMLSTTGAPETSVTTTVETPVTLPMHMKSIGNWGNTTIFWPSVAASVLGGFIVEGIKYLFSNPELLEAAVEGGLSLASFH